jgi:hypothetical protein
MRKACNPASYITSFSVPMSMIPCEFTVVIPSAFLAGLFLLNNKQTIAVIPPTTNAPPAIATTRDGVANFPKQLDIAQNAVANSGVFQCRTSRFFPCILHDIVPASPKRGLGQFYRRYTNVEMQRNNRSKWSAKIMPPNIDNTNQQQQKQHNFCRKN